MRRITIPPRSGWQSVVESQGLTYHSIDDQPYWDESCYYELSSAEVDALEAATNELHGMCLAAVQHVIDNDLFGRLFIPDFAATLIREAWEVEPPAIYGRFDLSFDGKNIKLLEYNADTPTALIEAAVIQWYWLQDVNPTADQFNSIHERLIAKWKELKKYVSKPLYFAAMDTPEDEMTVTYLRDTAEQAGISTRQLLVRDIGWRDNLGFVDGEQNPIHSCFKLYPWEWLVHEEYGPLLPQTSGVTQWIEPIWKMVLSNKGILPILWQMYPGHKHLLEASFDAPPGESYVKKPLLSREGANITLVSSGKAVVETEGDYGEEGFIYQAMAPLGEYRQRYPVIGSWVIDGESAGIGIRESDTPVTSNLSRFVPHLFL